VTLLTIASVVGGVVCLIGLWSSYRHGLIYRLLALRTVRFYRLRPEGQQEGDLARFAWVGERLASQMTEEHWWNIKTGMSITRVGSSGRSPETYLTLWNSSDPAIPVRTIAEICGGNVEAIDGFDAQWDGRIAEATRGRIGAPVVDPEELGRRADTVTRQLAHEDHVGIIHITFMPLRSEATGILADYFSKMVREKRAVETAIEQTAGTLLNGRILAAGGSSKAARALVESAAASLPAFHFAVIGRVVSARAVIVVLTIIAGLMAVAATIKGWELAAVAAYCLTLGLAFLLWKDPAERWVRFQARTGVVLPHKLKTRHLLRQRAELRNSESRVIKAPDGTVTSKSATETRLSWPRGILPFNGVQVASVLRLIR